MSSILSWLLGLTAIVTAADIWFFKGFIFLPHWLPTLLALAGLCVSAVAYSRRKKKKKAKKARRASLAALSACLVSALLVTGYWLFQLLSSVLLR